MEERKRSFDEVHQRVHPGYLEFGPRPAVDDLLLAAGLLFVRWNDRTSRALESPPGEAPYVVVTTHHVASSSGSRVYLTRSVSDRLWGEAWVEGDARRWRGALSAAGRQAVVRGFECGPMDAFAAGAAFDLAGGGLRWPA